MNRKIKWFLYACGMAVCLTMVGCPSTVVIKEETRVYRPAPKEPGPPPWAPAHGRRAKYRYHYFPESYVYFDIGRRLYFYYSGDRWHASVALPVGIRIEENRYVLLEMDVDEPYRFHSDVVKRYPPGLSKKSGEENDKGKGKGKEKGKWE